jgi:hypothetical protein
MDVEDEDLVGVEAARPEIAAVVREARVVRLVAPAHGEDVHDLSVAGRAGVDVDRHELVLLVPHALHAERPDVDEILLPDDLGHVGRQAGLVRACDARAMADGEAEERESPECRGNESDRAIHLTSPLYRPDAGRADSPEDDAVPCSGGARVTSSARHSTRNRLSRVNGKGAREGTRVALPRRCSYAPGSPAAGEL